MKKTFAGAITTPFLMTMLLSLATAVTASAQVPPPIVTPIVTTTYLGTQCRATNAPETDIVADSAGRLFNNSAAGQRGFVCPILHAAPETKVEVVTVRFLDRSLSSDLGCNVIAVGQNGATLASATARQSSGASPNEQAFMFDTASIGTHSNLVLSCGVPAGEGTVFGLRISGIASYDVTENLTALRILLH